MIRMRRDLRTFVILRILCGEKSRTKVSPTKFLTIFEIMECLCAKDIFNLVRLDRTNRRGTEHIDHVTCESFTLLDITRRAQTATLHNDSIDLIFCDELV